MGVTVYFFLLGAPGVGKGTQAVMLAEKKELVQVASGDLFRKALQQETELGKKAKVYMEKGQLVPDEITIQMVLERLAAPDCKNGAILDGFPRNLEQARALDEALKAQARQIDRVVYIKVSDAELLKRLQVYLAETAPLIEYYTASGKLVEVKGEGSVEDITRAILQALSRMNAP